MANDMPPVFYADYAAQQAERARKLSMGLKIDAWDLTGFFQPEVASADGENSSEIKAELDEESVLNLRCDSPVEDRKKKRKRTNEE